MINKIFSLKKKFAGFILCLGLLSLASCAQKKNNRIIPIAFYNVENFFDTQDDPNKDDDEFTPGGPFHYTERIYQQKLHNIATVLSQLGTDKNDNGPAIIGLAEVENDKVLSDLVTQPEIIERGYKFIWFSGPDPRGITVALLYDQKQFKLLNAKPIKVSLDNGEYTRDILFVTGTIAGNTVHILVNHWPSRKGEDETESKRMIAAKVDRNIIDSLLRNNPNANIVLMGDLNDNPDNMSITKVLGASGERGKTNGSVLFNPWLNIYRSGVGTLIHAHHWDLFDHIIISDALLNKNKLHFTEAAIFNRDFLITQRGRFRGYPHRSFGGTHWINGYSDHLPVVLYLERN
jgi:hypothetical protein